MAVAKRVVPSLFASFFCSLLTFHGTVMCVFISTATCSPSNGRWCPPAARRRVSGWLAAPLRIQWDTTIVVVQLTSKGCCRYCDFYNELNAYKLYACSIEGPASYDDTTMAVSAVSFGDKRWYSHCLCFICRWTFARHTISSQALVPSNRGQLLFSLLPPPFDDTALTLSA